MGIPANSTSEKFTEAEGFLNANLPWGWDLGRGWHLQSRVDLSMGWLGDSSDDAFIGSLGPSLVVKWRNFPVTFEGGASPTLLSRDKFESKDLGSKFQITSHAGLNWDVLSHLRLSYRFEHMSNAGLDSSHNPGFNMHVFAAGYVF